MYDIQINSEVEDDVGGDVPAIGVEAGSGNSATAYCIAKAESVACRKLDEVDDVEADAQVPAGLHGFGLHLLGICLTETEQQRRAGIDHRSYQIVSRGKIELIFEMQRHLNEITSYLSRP